LLDRRADGVLSFDATTEATIVLHPSIA